MIFPTVIRIGAGVILGLLGAIALAVIFDVHPLGAAAFVIGCGVVVALPQLGVMPKRGRRW